MKMRFEQFETIFKPKSVAIVGASNNPSKWGFLYLSGFKNSFPYSNNLYPVNPHETEILGLKVYPSVRDIPAKVDHVIIAVPAPEVRKVVEDCAVKGITAVSVYSGGFSEFNDEGKKMEEELVKIANGKVRIIGPNCLGPFTSELSLPGFKFSSRTGEVSFFSQSGGGIQIAVNLGNKIGVDFNKIISYGNACDLDSTDFIEYFGEDEETKVITGYMEGIKDAKRFLKVSENVTKRKPVIILKGGMTTTGTKAVASHTGSLAGSKEVWDAAFRQAGILKVQSFEELLSTTLAFLHIPRIGRRVGLIGIGGGAGVIGVDECERAGLVLPTFSPETISQLAQIVPPVGVNLRNPVDLSDYAVFNPSFLGKAAEIVSREKGVDVIILLYHNMYYYPEQLKIAEEAVTSIEIRKPTVVVMEPEAEREEIKPKHLGAGIPVYNSLIYATRALSNLITYYEFRK